MVVVVVVVVVGIIGNYLDAPSGAWIWPVSCLLGSRCCRVATKELE